MIAISNLGFLYKLTIFIVIVQSAGSLNCRQQALLWHNHYRKIHQVGNVTWSFGLLRKARKWAIHLADNNLFIHEEKDPGNLFLSGGKPVEPCALAVKLFYAEEKNYDYKKPEVFKGAGHFTQVVWKNTKQIGAFSKVRKDGKTVVVVKYDPPGNVRGYFAKNVFPPKKPSIMTSPTPITDVTTAGNATYSNFTTPKPKRKPNVKAGAIHVKERWAHFVMQWLLIGFLLS